MSDDSKLDAFELDRLDLFATQIVLRVLLHHMLQTSGNADALARELGVTVDATVDNWKFEGVAGPKEDAAREYLRTKSAELVHSSVRKAGE